MTSEEKKLTRRYLIWCYKTTKEASDRVDRKFTQLFVDKELLNQLQNSKDKVLIAKKIDEFKVYMADKKRSALSEKFSNNDHTQLQADYLYLKNRLAGVEKAISFFLSKKSLIEIKSLYEKEMTRRILESREHF